MRVLPDIQGIPQTKVTIKTCADVYECWRTKKRRYKRAPRDGVQFQIDYIDTGLSVDQQTRDSAPIVLALHGAPGSYHDFSLLIKHLHKRNVRVIVPNFPEYITTINTKRLFRHSADEKAAYLRDFLRSINVTTIDLLVSHSSAIFPSLLILMNGSTVALSKATEISRQTPPSNLQRQLNKDKAKAKAKQVSVKFEHAIEIKSIALLNPAGHRLPMSMKPVWFKCGSCRIYQHKLGRSLFRKLGPAFLTVIGVPVRVNNMDNVMLSATVMRNSKCPRVVDQLKQLSEMKLPTLLVFSENDKLIEKEIFYEMSDFMSLDSKNFDIFNNEGNIELARSCDDDWVRVMVFKAGGHYAYSNYANTVNNAISELLEKVVIKSRDASLNSKELDTTVSTTRPKPYTSDPELAQDSSGHRTGRIALS